MFLTFACKESDEDRAQRLEKGMNNAVITRRIMVNMGMEREDLATDKVETPLTPDEKNALDTTKKLVLFCATDLGAPFQRVQAELMRVGMRRLPGYRLKVLDCAGNLETQMKQLKELGKDMPAWLVVQPVEPRVSSSLLEALRSSKTKVLGLDPTLPPSSCDSQIFTDEVKVGRIAGEHVVAALRKKAQGEGKSAVVGRVVHLMGPAGGSVGQQRAKGFNEALASEPGIQVVHEAAGDWRQASGRDLMAEALRLQKTVDVVFAHNDAMAHGASEMLTQSQIRDHVLIVGVDAVPGHDGGVDLIRRGVLDATVFLPMPLETVFNWVQQESQGTNPKLEPRVEREPKLVMPSSLDAAMNGRTL